MSTIQSLSAVEVLDSRGTPTVQAKVVLSDNTASYSAVPSGVSKTASEATELRDNDPNHFNGLGVKKAVNNINTIIAEKLLGVEASDQKMIDKMLIELDGTENKSKLGANAILAVSQAVVKASAESASLSVYQYIATFMTTQMPYKLPIPIFNIVEGGKHADSEVDFQEFLVIPASTKSFYDSIEIGVSIYQSVKRVLFEQELSPMVADEGGFSAELANNKAALSILKGSIEKTQHKFALDVFLGLDVAANSFGKPGNYTIKDRSTPYNSNELVEFYEQLVSDFSLIYLEDAFCDTDLDAWKKLMTALSSKVIIAGDDLTATNPYRLQTALAAGAINGIVIKPNQIGTISEATAVVEMARYKNLKIIVAHRSGETTDDFIADFAIGVGADYVKFGPPARERIAKYNRLLQIANEILPPQAENPVGVPSSQPPVNNHQDMKQS